MNVYYYDVSFVSKKDAKFHILPSGIVKFEKKELNLFIRPVNKLLIKEDEQFLFWSLNKSRSKSIFTEPYYPEGSSLETKPDYFYIEILFNPKVDGLVFYPKRIEIINENGNQIGPTEYIAVEKLLEEPNNSGNSNLFYYIYNKEWFKYTHKTNVDTAIVLPYKKLIGFAIRFNMFPPSPGESFTIKIDKLEYEGNSIDVPDILFDSKKTFVFRAY